MFKMPEKQRIQEIADMIPGWISTFSSKGVSSSKTIAKMRAALQLHKIAKELGVPTLSYSSSFGIKDVVDIMREYNVPDMLILKTKIGRFKVFFHNGSEMAIFDMRDSLESDYMDACVYVISSLETPPVVFNMLKGLGVKSYKNLITGFAKKFK